MSTSAGGFCQAVFEKLKFVENLKNSFTAFFDGGIFKAGSSPRFRAGRIFFRNFFSASLSFRRFRRRTALSALFRIGTAIAAGLFLSGCSSMEKSCQGINWHEAGRQDSSKGVSFEESFEERREMCSLDPDSIYVRAYRNGFKAGASEYCNFKTGYIYGFSQLEKKTDGCPPDQRKLFLNGFKMGAYMSQIQQLRASLENKIDSIRQEIKKQEKRLKYAAPTAELSFPASVENDKPPRL